MHSIVPHMQEMHSFLFTHKIHFLQSALHLMLCFLFIKKMYVHLTPSFVSSIARHCCRPQGWWIGSS
jgi:hypothetical protein